MPNNAELFNQWAAKNGSVSKAEGGLLDLDTVTFGGIIPKPLVLELISLTRSQNAWLGAVSSPVRSRQAGNIPIVELNEPVTEYVGTNDGTKVTFTPPTRMVPYSCKKFKSEFYVTTEELREAVEAGIDDFENKMTGEWTTQLGNDIAKVVMQGDKSLDTSTRLNRLLRAVDGVDIQTATANVFDAGGKAFDQGVFASMQDFMPERFAEDPNLQWMFNRRVNNKWMDSLTNVNTTERMRSELGDSALTSMSRVQPLGIPQLIVPQIKATNGLAPIAPTSAAASGGGILFELATMVGVGLSFATVAAGDTRKVKVTYLPSGLSETIAAIDNTTLQLTTIGKLGQVTVSTTAADYTVEGADETELYYGNPKAINVVYCNEWRSFREFNKDFDRFEITTYVEFDVIVPTPELFVKYTRVSVPAISW